MDGSRVHTDLDEAGVQELCRPRSDQLCKVSMYF